LFYRHKLAADGVYQAALRAEATRRLGLEWTDRRGVWEVEGIPAGLCRQFSKRRTQIDQALAEHGTSGGRAAQAAALDTRSAKPKSPPTVSSCTAAGQAKPRRPDGPPTRSRRTPSTPPPTQETGRACPMNRWWKSWWARPG
jgi:TrwC relaxase